MSAARSRRSAQWSVDPSRNYLPGTCSPSAARDLAGARCAVVAPGSGTAGHTLTRVRRTHAPRDRLVRLSALVRAVVHLCSQLRVLGSLTEPFALHRPRIRSAMRRFAIAGSPKLAPPGSGSSTSRGYVRRLPLEPASGPGRGAGDGTATTARTATGRAHAARARRAVPRRHPRAI